MVLPTKKIKVLAIFCCVGCSLMTTTVALASIFTEVVDTAIDRIPLPESLEKVNEILKLEQVLKDPGNAPENILNNALDYAKFGVVNVLGEQLGKDCPEIMRIVPGPCPDGGAISSDNGRDSTGKTQVKTSSGLRSISLPTGDALSSNPKVAARDLANLYDQEYARARAAPFLGETGQEWLELNAAATISLVQQNTNLATEIQKLATSGQDTNITQEAIKKLLLIQNHQAQISLTQSQMQAQMGSSLLSLVQQQANIMQQTANLGEGLDESNRRERLERDVLYSEAERGAIYLPGFKW